MRFALRITIFPARKKGFPLLTVCLVSDLEGADADAGMCAQVRLEHMLQRLRVLQDAAATARPTRLLPHLWVAGAVEANSLHVLRHLGITHILNATEDLLLPEPNAAFMCVGPIPSIVLFQNKTKPSRAAPPRRHPHPQCHQGSAAARARCCIHVRSAACRLLCRVICSWYFIGHHCAQCPAKQSILSDTQTSRSTATPRAISSTTLWQHNLYRTLCIQNLKRVVAV